MAIQILRDLRGLRVHVVHPPDTERTKLVEHLRRIGCMAETQWPVPDCWAEGADIVILAIEHDVRAEIQHLLKSDSDHRPTLIAVVSYEDPSTLQLVLEAGAVAVIERPIRPFGLLTNLTIARSLWLERREAEKRVRKLERKLAGIQRIQKAKVILMDGQGLSEAEAYESIRRQAMSKRLSTAITPLPITALPMCQDTPHRSRRSALHRSRRSTLFRYPKTCRSDRAPENAAASAVMHVRKNKKARQILADLSGCLAAGRTSNIDGPAKFTRHVYPATLKS